MTNAVWALWNAYTQARLGGADSWTGQRQILKRMLGQPGGAWFWREYRHEFDPHFQAEVDRLLASDD